MGGLYFGTKETGINEDGKRFVSETLEYNEDQIKRIAKGRVRYSTKKEEGVTIYTKAMCLNPAYYGMKL